MKIDDVVFVYQLKEVSDIMWHSRKHGHRKNQIEITYFMKGSGTFCDEGRKYRIFNNALFINTEERIHYVVADDLTKPLSYFAILFSVDESETELMEIARSIELGGPVKVSTDHRFFCEELRVKVNSGSKYLMISAEHQVMQLMYKLPSINIVNETQSSHYHIEKAIKYLSSNLTENITLEDLSREINLSESYLNRIFTKNLGATPMRFYAKLKIDAAMGMLETTTLSIRQIANRLSYSSEFHFSRQFKQYTGKTPSSYRKSTMNVK